MRRTEKQRAIMQIVLKAADAGDMLTIQELHAQLPYACAYGSLRTSLRFLEKGGAILRDRAGQVTVIRPTSHGYSKFR